jgi:spore coat protein U-like protein
MRGAAVHQTPCAAGEASALLPFATGDSAPDLAPRATSRGLTALGVVLVAGAALTLAPHARADEIDGLRSMNLQVYGHLDQHCMLGKIDDADFGDLTRPGMHADSRVALDCNMPINVRISAAHGAVANERYPQGQGPYAGAVPYRLEVRIPVRRPAHDVVTRSFEGQDLVAAGQTVNTGDGIAVDGMNLSVALSPPANSAGLLAGHYSETIEITVTPS